MLRKCNRLLAHILAFALVITTFGSDLTSAKVFAEGSEIEAEVQTEEPAVDAPAQNEEPVNEEPKAEEPVEKTPDEEVEEPSEEEESVEIPEGQQPKADTPENQSDDQTTDGQGDVKLSMLQMSEKVVIEDSKKVEAKGMEGNPVPEDGYFSITYESGIDTIPSNTLSYSVEKLEDGKFELPAYGDVFDSEPQDRKFIGWTADSNIITSISGIVEKNNYTITASWETIVSEPSADTDNKDKKSLTGSYDSVNITVEPENGVLPSDASLVIGDIGTGSKEYINSKVSEYTNGDKTKTVTTFDVAVYSDGKEWQPEGGSVKVTVSLKDGTSGQLTLLHFGKNSIENKEDKGESVTITLKDLSPFALIVTPEEETPEVENNVIIYHKNIDETTDEPVKRTIEWEEGVTEQDIDVETYASVFGENKDERRTFLGWSTEQAGDVVYPAKKLGAITVEKDNSYELFAQWEENYEISFKAFYYINGNLESSDTIDDKKIYAAADSEVKASSLQSKVRSRFNYSLEGLYEDEELSTQLVDFKITEDKKVYAKYVAKETVDAYFFLLNSKVRALSPEEPGHQPDLDYYPSGKGIWKGHAKNIDLLDSSIVIKGLDDKYGYKAVYDWNNGLPSSVEYGYEEGTTGLIDAYLEKYYNDDEHPGEYTYKDIRWYVYKNELYAAVKNHIDGYVTTNIIYDANTAVSSGTGVTEPERVRIGESVTIKNNMFKPADPDLIFVGWNTEADGTGTYYFEKIGSKKIGDSLQLDHKTVLYAQWIKVPEKYRKIVIQADAQGTDKDTYLPYNGKEQSAVVNVKVTAEEKENLHTSALKNVMENASDVFMAGVDSLINLCTIVAYAETPKTSNVDANGKVAPQTVTIGDATYSIDVEVDGLKVNGGKGTNVGDYGVDLVYDDMVINASVNGHKVDIRDKFIIEVTPAGTKETSEETEGKEKTDTICYLHVTPLHIDITTNTHSRQYDGTALSDGTIIYGTSDRFVDGEASISVPNSITNVGSVSNAIVITPLAQKYKDDPELFSGKDGKSNYVISLHPGTLTIYNPGGDTPPSPPTPPTPPTVTPPAGQVLGATRAVGGDGAAVLGARRGRTEDSTNTLGRIITIIVAAGIGFTMIFIKRKKSEEE